MALLPGEQILFTKNNLEITNYRVRHDDDKQFCSILIKNVSSISITSKSSPAWIIAAVMCFSTPAVFNRLMGMEGFSLFVVMGVICVIAYFYTTKKTIVISSKGGDAIRYEGDYRQSEVIADMIENHLLVEDIHNSVPF